MNNKPARANSIFWESLGVIALIIVFVVLAAIVLYGWNHLKLC